MKIYGMPRLKALMFPDVGDIKETGRKTSIGGKSYFKKSSVKRATRRYFKRLARAFGKKIDFED